MYYIFSSLYSLKVSLLSTIWQEYNFSNCSKKYDWVSWIPICLFISWDNDVTPLPSNAKRNIFPKQQLHTVLFLDIQAAKSICVCNIGFGFGIKEWSNSVKITLIVLRLEMFPLKLNGKSQLATGQ